MASSWGTQSIEPNEPQVIESIEVEDAIRSISLNSTQFDSIVAAAALPSPALIQLTHSRSLVRSTCFELIYLPHKSSQFEHPSTRVSTAISVSLAIAPMDRSDPVREIVTYRELHRTTEQPSSRGMVILILRSHVGQKFTKAERILGCFPLDFFLRGGEHTRVKLYLQDFCKLLTSFPKYGDYYLEHEKFRREKNSSKVREGVYIFNVLTEIKLHAGPEYNPGSKDYWHCFPTRIPVPMSYELHGDFQNAVVARDDHKCVITGAEDNLIAANIIPISLGQEYFDQWVTPRLSVVHAANGITLRSDWRRAFDLYQWGFQVSNSGELYLHYFGSTECGKSMHGKIIDLSRGTDDDLQPNRRALVWHYVQCLLAQKNRASSVVDSVGRKLPLKDGPSAEVEQRPARVSNRDSVAAWLRQIE